MKKKLLSFLSALLITILITSTAGAEGVVKLRGVAFSLGSLIAKGYASGLGNTDVTVVLDASGIPVTTCTNNGGNDVPGQSFPKVSASGQQSRLGNDPIRENGRSPFGVETADPVTLSWDVAGCPGPNWTARIDFIYWTNASITVHEGTATGPVLRQQNYLCTTTREPASVTCTPTN